MEVVLRGALKDFRKWDGGCGTGVTISGIREIRRRVTD